MHLHHEVIDAFINEFNALTFTLRYRRWSVYEEEKLLMDLNKLLSKKENQTAKLRLLRRQLHVRKVRCGHNRA